MAATLPELKAMDAHTRITGKEREALGTKVLKHYKSGTPVRQIAAEVGRSYGFVSTLLKESGADMRPRGGARLRGSGAMPRADVVKTQRVAKTEALHPAKIDPAAHAKAKVEKAAAAARTRAVAARTAETIKGKLPDPVKAPARKTVKRGNLAEGSGR